DEVVGALLDRRDRGFDVAVARDHHDRQIGMLLLDRIKQLEPVEAAPLQPDIEEDETWPPRRYRNQGIVGIPRRTGQVALVLEDAGNQLPDIGLVVNDEDVSAHGSRTWLTGWSLTAASWVRRRPEPAPSPRKIEIESTLLAGLAPWPKRRSARY